MWALGAVEQARLHFRAGNGAGFSFFVFSLCCSIFVFRMNVHFHCIRFSFFSAGQEIGLEVHLQNNGNLFCVEWDVKF